MWTSLLQGRDLLAAAGRWHLNGFSDLVVDKNLWLSSGKFLITNPVSRMIKVRDLVELDGQRWDQNKLAEYIHPSSIDEVLQTPICHLATSDEFWWPGTKSGEYTIRTSYHQFRIRNEHKQEQQTAASASLEIPDQIWNQVWEARVPQKVKGFIWRIMNNAIPTKEALGRKKLTQDINCPICGSNVETMEHLFLLCEWTTPIWFGLGFVAIPNPWNVT